VVSTDKKPPQVDGLGHNGPAPTDTAASVVTSGAAAFDAEQGGGEVDATATEPTPEVVAGLEHDGAEAIKPRKAADHEQISALRRKASPGGGTAAQRREASDELTEIVDGDLRAYALDRLDGIAEGEELLASLGYSRQEMAPQVFDALLTRTTRSSAAPSFGGRTWASLAQAGDPQHPDWHARRVRKVLA
jgi:hypothetical protein